MGSKASDVPRVVEVPYVSARPAVSALLRLRDRACIHDSAVETACIELLPCTVPRARPVIELTPELCDACDIELTPSLIPMTAGVPCHPVAGVIISTLDTPLPVPARNACDVASPM